MEERWSREPRDCSAVYEVENLSEGKFSRKEFILEVSTNGAFTLLFL